MSNFFCFFALLTPSPNLHYCEGEKGLLWKKRGCINGGHWCTPLPVLKITKIHWSLCIFSTGSGVHQWPPLMHPHVFHLNHFCPSQLGLNNIKKAKKWEGSQPQSWRSVLVHVLGSPSGLFCCPHKHYFFSDHWIESSQPQSWRPHKHYFFSDHWIEIHQSNFRQKDETSSKTIELKSTKLQKTGETSSSS